VTAAPAPAAPAFEVDELAVSFRREKTLTPAVTGVSFAVDAGETLVLLGESGSGKSVSCLAAMGLLGPSAQVSGSVRIGGREVLGLPESELVGVRGRRIGMVFQDSLSGLNPVLTVGFQIAEVLRKQLGMKRAAAKRHAVELMQRVAIPDAARRFSDHPHQFSGGMRQRVMIAMAIAAEPEVLIADEPTTALDVTVQAQIMDLLAGLQAERAMGLLLITHDLGVAAEVADRICVMYAGRVVETADVRSIYSSAAHPYTRGLLASVPRLDMPRGELRAIPGIPSGAGRAPAGCSFHPRCYAAQDRCAVDEPALLPVPGLRPDRASACHYAAEVAAR
jgi:oligopeptide transport system ATP-binding protein